MEWGHEDTFLASIGYVGDDDYEAMRALVRALALATVRSVSIPPGRSALRRS